MIKYSSQTPGLGLPIGVTCFMLDLYNAYGTISGRIIVSLPDHDYDLQICLFSNVVAIPDLGLSFRILAYSPEDIAHIIRKKAELHNLLTAALAATIHVMDMVVDSECEHFDSETNLAAIPDIARRLLFRGDDDDLPF